MRLLWLERAYVPPQPFPLRLSHVLTNQERYRRILANHLPAQAVDHVYNYLNLHKVHFHITRGRTSKLGDYRWPQANHDFHEISINGDLNPYLFLWVFLHEAAHLETHLHHEGVTPHGHEWQSEYARLISTHAGLFPADVQPLLTRLARRIPLKRTLLRQVEALLHHYDPDYTATVHLVLDDLPAGSRFRLKNKPELLFESLERRRTRWLCREVTTGRTYTVAATAEVTKH